MLKKHHLKQTLLTYFQTYQPQMLEQPDHEQLLEAKLAEIETAIQDRF